jgi:hypothetical protein
LKDMGAPNDATGRFAWTSILNWLWLVAGRRKSAVTLRLDPAEMLALYGFLALGSHFGAVMAGENSQFSPDEVRTYTAAISTGAATTLVDKISAAAKQLKIR